MGFGAVFALLIAGTITSGMSVPLHHLNVGKGTVHYFHPPNVVLDFRLATGKVNRIPLSYEEIGQQRRGEIWNATVIAESPGQFVIFTDRFSSNANIQGQCGANPDGERYLHVVKLTIPMQETLSQNIDSCYRSLSTINGYPQYNSATHILVVKIKHEDTSVTSVNSYRISTNGGVETIH